MSDEQEYLGEAYLDFSKKCMKMEGTCSLDVYLILTANVIAKKKKNRTINLSCNKILIQALNIK